MGIQTDGPVTVAFVEQNLKQIHRVRIDRVRDRLGLKSGLGLGGDNKI